MLSLPGIKLYFPKHYFVYAGRMDRKNLHLSFGRYSHITKKKKALRKKQGLFLCVSRERKFLGDDFSLGGQEAFDGFYTGEFLRVYAVSNHQGRRLPELIALGQGLMLVHIHLRISHAFFL